ncbi:hypothetical protein Sa4125_43750 [Aureimonas sp. SA4125]|uniref:cell envelope integrity protein TolA n=1 Tax=Aureimonas sp. SA4125 TaxID=2826993 RepID=UPI001CC69B57|nr:cell envelope integrity protein TolA [Aureimonas sp. SA4125]BDA86833.1 hypothetical protein Sa4125_43750 [Aureimonas sp. SA4125]
MYPTDKMMGIGIRRAVALAGMLVAMVAPAGAQEVMEAPQPDLPAISAPGALNDATEQPTPGPLGADPAAPPVRPSAIPTGQPELLPGVIDSQIQKCWSVPVMKGDIGEGGVARIRVKLQPDGTLAAPPAIIDKPAGRLGGIFAESAAAAISKCAPYRLPPEQYESWKDLMLVFDTLDF